MTRDSHELNRRQILGSIGAIGLASAGAGYGTSAYFSDSEDFENNAMVAGALDLKVDWEEHYSDWSPDEGTLGTNVWMPGDDGIPEDAVPVPTATEPMLYIGADHLTDFMDATAVEAYPDGAVDGGPQDGIQDEIPEDTACTFFTDVGPDAPGLSSQLRTEGSFAGQTTESGDPLFNLTDVKPGDFGEATLSLHLCDNPGYLWANGELLANDENTVTEPEAADPDEDQTQDDPDDAFDGELAQELMVAMWYDHGETPAWDGDAGEGDNVMQASETIVELGDAVAVGSLETVMGLLNSNDGLGIPLDGGLETGFGEVEPVGSEVAVSGEVETLAEFECETVDGNPECSDYGLLRAIKLDEDEGEITVGDHPTPAGTVTVVSKDVQAGTVTLSTDFPVSAVITKGGPKGRVCRANADGDDTPLEAGDGVGLDQVTVETPENSNNGTNYGLSHVSVCYRGDVPGGGTQVEGERECFVNSTTAYIGFAWWLPTDHANEIQTDSVTFDLGFYTEQCRHNDGSGMTQE